MTPARKIAQATPPVSDRGFRPFPFLANAHVQTLLGTLLVGRPLNAPAQGHRVDLPDGDALMYFDSRPPGWHEGDRIALIIHGLGGSHKSRHVQRIASMLLPLGFRVIRMDMRGCGEGLKTARRCYHGGCSADVRAVAAALARESPRSPLTLIGLSLGGNIVLKLAGERRRHPVANLERVAALAPPIDIEKCAAMLSRPACRFYERHFLKDLIAEAHARRTYFPDLPPVNFPRRMTIRLFDDLYTAPAWGFADALDYYRQSASFPVIGSIETPTFILTARDDPFIAIEPFENLTLPSHVRLEIQNHGGHLGFLGSDGAGGYRWAERRIVQWAAGELNSDSV